MRMPTMLLGSDVLTGTSMLHSLKSKLILAVHPLTVADCRMSLFLKLTPYIRYPM